MKPIKLFYLKGCPYCRKAMECMKEITERCPELRAVEVEPIEEREHADIADRYDYHYVPAFYIGGRKVHEGAAGSDDVEKVLRMALEE